MSSRSMVEYKKKVNRTLTSLGVMFVVAATVQFVGTAYLWPADNQYGDSLAYPLSVVVGLAVLAAGVSLITRKRS